MDKVGEILHGFRVTRIRNSEELGARVVEMVYDATGTELCWVDNGEENKLFSVTFKTLPENSTGVFHILEHSVLCGSKKFPVKEPFVELIKSSMNTFLNAMTFQDKTMYPISSRNEKDFLNLTSVYLDAVFEPAILENPNIFYQEGWHVEEGEEGYAFKGVVFNEMKGALSGADRLTEQKMIEMLFPDSPYGYNSGGDPMSIPDLTYEEFKETYRRFYHPSNAKIFLDGTVPMNETLALIASYLEKFEKSEDLPVFSYTRPLSVKETVYYDQAPEEPLIGKSHLLWGKIVGDYTEHTKWTALGVLKKMLSGTNESPLKRAILSAHLAEDVEIDLDNILPQPYITVHFTNIKDGAEEEVLRLTKETLAALKKEGLSKAALHATANRMEFSLLEPDEPAGLERCIAAMTGWLHGGDPLEYMCYKEDFRAVHEMIDAGEMEALMEEVFLTDEGAAVLLAHPSHTKGEEEKKREREKLCAMTGAWSEAEKEENRRKNEALFKWQEAPDSKEALSTLPRLTLEDVGAPPKKAETAVMSVGEGTFIYHPVNTHGIVHVGLYFSLGDRSLSDLTYLAAGQRLWGKLPTANYSAEELEEELKRHVGSISFAVSGYGNVKNRAETRPVFAARMSVLAEELPRAKELLIEILTATRFDDSEKIKDILVQSDEYYMKMGISAGHILAMGNATAAYSAGGALLDAVGGYTFIRALHDMRENFNERLPLLREQLAGLRESAFCQSRLTVSVTASEKVPAEDLFAAFPAGKNADDKASYRCDLPDKMGCPIPAMIGFSSEGYHLSEMGEAFHGRISVAANILSFGYLWNKVRVQGGAYGTGIAARRNGMISSYSYRDPSPQKSIEANKGLGDYLRAFAKSDEEITGYVISTLAKQDPLVTPGEKGAAADADYFTQNTPEDDRRIWEEILHTTKEDLVLTVPIWERFAEMGRSSVVGPRDMLKDMEVKEL